MACFKHDERPLPFFAYGHQTVMTVLTVKPTASFARSTATWQRFLHMKPKFGIQAIAMAARKAKDSNSRIDGETGLPPTIIDFTLFLLH